MPKALTPWEMERAARERAAEAAEAAAAAAAEAAAQAAAAKEGKPAGANGNGGDKPSGVKRKPVRLQMEEHSFNGPSRPRAIYSRPSKELPSLKVGRSFWYS